MTADLPPLRDDPTSPSLTVRAPAPVVEPSVWTDQEQEPAVESETLPEDLQPLSEAEVQVVETEGYKTPTGYKMLRPRQRRAVRLAFSGITYAEVGRRVGYSKEHVSTLVRSAEGQHYMDWLHTQADVGFFSADVQLMFQQNSVAAVSALVAPLSNPNADPRLRQTSAIAILDYAGHRPTAKAEVAVNNSLTKDDLLRLNSVDGQLAALKAAAETNEQSRKDSLSPGG
jgi:hypothetical protein